MIRKLFESLQNVFEMDTATPKSKPQRAFKQVVDSWAVSQDKLMGQGESDKYRAAEGLMYAFHDDKSIATDGDLYDILNYGHGDYHYGSELKQQIDQKMKQLGYYLENAGGGVFSIVKESVQESRKQIKEARIVEGEFSWKLPDGEPIYSSEGHQKTVYMLDDKGNKWQEDAYEGYGVFGGKDYYDLVAEMNGVTTAPEGQELRSLGIDMAYGDNPVKLPRFSTDPNVTYDQLPDPESDPDQGWWHGNPGGEDDDYEEDEGSWRDDEAVQEGDEDLLATKTTSPDLKSLVQAVKDDPEELDLEDVDDAPKEADEEEEIIDAEGNKEYLGNNDHDTFFYLIKVPNETGGLEEIQIVDAGGEVKFSSKDEGLDAKDVKNFILQGLKKLEIANLSYDTVLKYLIPDEEEVEAEEEDDVKPANPEIDNKPSPDREMSPPEGGGGMPRESVVTEKEPKAELDWRGKQKSGKIMKPSTFDKIAKGAKKSGYDNPEAVAGAAYWNTVRSKYKKSKVKEALDEALTDAGVTKVQAWVGELGARKAGVKLMDVLLNKQIGLTTSDLPDTATFANGLDGIEDLLKDGNIQGAYAEARETIKLMLEEEGFEEDGYTTEGKIPPDSSSGPEMYISLLLEKYGLMEAERTPEDAKEIEEIGALSRQYGFGTVAWQDALIELTKSKIDNNIPIGPALASFIQTQIEHTQRLEDDFYRKWQKYDLKPKPEVGESIVEAEHIPLKIMKTSKNTWKVIGSMHNPSFDTREEAIKYAEGLEKETKELKAPRPYKITTVEDEAVEEGLDGRDDKLIAMLKDMPTEELKELSLEYTKVSDKTGGNTTSLAWSIASLVKNELKRRGVVEGKLPPDASSDPEGYIGYLREKHGLVEPVTVASLMEKYGLNEAEDLPVPPQDVKKASLLPQQDVENPEKIEPGDPNVPQGPEASGQDVAVPATNPQTAEAQIRMDYPEEPLTSTALAYADLIVDNPQVFGAIRNLQWDGVYTNGDTFLKQAKVIGKYNNFTTDSANRLVDKLRQSAKYRLARDGSVAVYVTITDPKTETSLEALKALVDADSVEKTTQPGEVKIWWD